MQILKAPICIVGAGPAGLSTSLYLARQGIASTVLDKGQFPRDKACGDNISGNTIRTISDFFPDFASRLKTDRRITELKGAVIYAPNNHTFEIDYLPLEKDTDLPSCYAISRLDLDEFLSTAVKKHPLIQLRENTRINAVENCTDGLALIDNRQQIRFETPLAIIATGSNCSLPAKLGAFKDSGRHSAIGIRAYFEGVRYRSGGSYSELYLMKELMPGGLYVTPLSNGLVNVNLCMREDVVQRDHLQLKKLLLEALKEHPVLRESFKDARQVGGIQGSRLRLGTRRRRLSGDHFLLVGDAAGLIDLLSANGIPQGLASAKIAAEWAAMAWKKGSFKKDALRGYDRQVHRRVAHYLKLGRLMAPLMGYRLFNHASLALMNFIARKFSHNDHLRNLMYDDKVASTLIKPSFYYNVFFGVKNKECL